MLCLLERKSCDNSSVLRVFMDFSGTITSMVTDWWRFPNIFKQTSFLSKPLCLKKKKKKSTLLNITLNLFLL